MTKLTIWTGLLGLLFGSAISAYAHTGNGFETGPLVFLGLTLSAIGGLGSAFLIFVVGKRSHVVCGIGVFFATMLIALIFIPMVWPYQKPLGPVPLNGESRSVERK